MNNEEIKRWLKTIATALVIFVLVSAYLYFRRGMYGLGNINKALAYDAALLAGLTLMIRPLLSYVKAAAQLMTIRRHIGLVAFALALIHVIISIFFIPERFTLDWYKQEWVVIAFGVVAICIWAYLTFISRNSMITKLGNTKWRIYQSWGGKIAFLLVYFHLIHLKYQDWSRWATGQLKPAAYLKNPTYIPESLIIFAVMTIIIVYRIFHDLSQAAKTTANETQPTS